MLPTFRHKSSQIPWITAGCGERTSRPGPWAIERVFNLRTWPAQSRRSPRCRRGVPPAGLLAAEGLLRQVTDPDHRPETKYQTQLRRSLVKDGTIQTGSVTIESERLRLAFTCTNRYAERCLELRLYERLQAARSRTARLTYLSFPLKSG
jgi:hypothetical protein